MLWGTDNLKNEGGPIGQALALIGARPRFDFYGRLAGATLVPLAELGRPRIDVTVRISGFFRDAFPHVIEILDDATCVSRIESTTDWDLYINSAGTEDSVTNDWSHWLPAEAFGGHSQNWIYDDELQELYKQAHDSNTTSQEIVDECANIIKDNAYVYGLCQNNYNIVYNTNTVSEVLINNKCFICPWCSVPA